MSFPNKYCINLIFILRDYFVDFCNKKVDANVLVVMKDPSLKNKGVQGEFLINKVM